MSTRRPRVKAAAILKPRRPLNANETNASGDKSIKTEQNPDETEADTSKDESTKECDDCDGVGEIEEKSDEKIDGTTVDYDTAIKPTLLPQAKMTAEPVPAPPPPVPSSTSSSFRRKSTPPVNIINRRRSVNRAANCSSPKYIRSPSYSFVSQVKLNTTKPTQTPTNTAATTTTSNCDEEVFSPASNNECFKSPPFMSPIYTPRRGVEPSSPFHDIYGEDCTKSPSQLPNNSTNSNSSSSSNSNAKLRQRIRPTPCFASRRNSIQGNSLSAISGGCESEDEQYRRQRHYSTSSNHSAYNPASTPQHQRNYFGLNKMPARVRTESYSSNISDMPFSKAKRSHRSEEYQRVANAKREFNQRLNGKPPDKTRLTMYDLIYYNPLTNPMSKPMGKGDGKNGDVSSLASAKTNQSRASIKSHASVKSERSESSASQRNTSGPAPTAAAEATADGATPNSPVPQLKLDVNGEIILDEKSLVIETTANKEAREVLASSDVVYDDEFSGTSGFYKRQKRTRDWLPLETLKFYRSLQTIGTDFSVMLQLFPNRSRRDLKLKFKKEEKHNMVLINKALLHPKEFNVDELKLQFDKEDEEIEQKKKEWAEVRKRLASERREQLNASKRRNPNKQISRSMRHLTDGDILYENEFVTLPPKSRRNRKPAEVQPDDSVFSPPSINHNNNHVDSLPQHTYATHKLPNFHDMIAAQHKSNAPANSNHIDQSNSIASPNKSLSPSPSHNPSPSHSPNANQIDPIDYTTQPSHQHNNQKYLNIESNGDAYAAEDYYDLSTATTTTTSANATDMHESGAGKTALIVQQQQRLNNNGNSVVCVIDDNCANESVEISQYSQYIAKNPNLTFKGTGDIMNMDIIFENICIEEDTSITNKPHVSAASDAATITSSSSSSSHDSRDVIASNHIDTNNADAEQQIEHVNINGVHYQIITIENETEPTDTAAGVTEFMEDAEDVANDDDDSNSNQIPVIIQANDQHEPAANDDLIDTNLMHLDVAAEEETAGEMDECVADRSVRSQNVKSESNDEMGPMLQASSPTDQPIRTNEINTARERRKRKQKAIPLLAHNKRTRRSLPKNESKLSDTEPSKLECESDARVLDHIESENQPFSNACQIDQHAEQTFTPCDDDGDCADIDDINSENSQIIEENQTDMDDIPERSFLDSLVVVESQDPNDPNHTIHEVFVVDPETNEMSEKPLDLPEHVIQRIRLAMS